MKTILIIDDDPLIRKTLSTHLSKEKYEVELAESAEEGFEKFNQSMPDLIILDIRLPDMDGLDALKMIKERDKNAR